VRRSRRKSLCHDQTENTASQSAPVSTCHNNCFQPAKEQFPVAARHALPERQDVLPIRIAFRESILSQFLRIVGGIGGFLFGGSVAKEIPEQIVLYRFGCEFVGSFIRVRVETADDQTFLDML